MQAHLKSLSAVLTVAALFFLLTARPCAAQFTATDLGVLAGHSYSRADVINASGLIAGVSYTEELVPEYGYWEVTAERACVWLPGDVTPTALPLLDGYTDSAVRDVNSSGLIVGFCYYRYVDPDYGYWYNIEQACLWQRVDGLWTVTGLGFLPGAAHNTSRPAYGTSINVLGQVVGESGLTQTEDWGGFIWDSINGMQPFTNLPDGPNEPTTSMRAEAISDNGWVIGQAMGGTHTVNGGVIWDSATKTTLAFLPWTEPAAISPSGLVAGSAYRLDAFGEPILNDRFLFVWNNGVLSDLGRPTVEPPLPGAQWMSQDVYPDQINDDGKILLYGYVYWDFDGDGWIDYDWDIDGDGELETAVTSVTWLWSNGIYSDLTAVLPAGVEVHDLYAIMNSLGHVTLLNVEWSAQPTAASYFWSGTGMAEPLTGLGGGVDFVFALNDGDKLVGMSYLAGGAGRHAVVWEPIGSTNQPPIANAGTDFAVTVPHDGDPWTNIIEVFLDGAASFDPDGDIITFSWFEGGIEIAAGPTPSVTLQPGVHTFTLIVTDPSGESDTDEVVVTVEPEPNEPPFAYAGQNQYLIVPHDGNPATNTVEVTLDGSESFDPDGDTVTYEWVYDGKIIASTDITKVSLAAGTHYFMLLVTDPYGWIGIHEVVVTVDPEPNQAPTADAGPDQSVPASGLTTTVTLNGSASSDPDGDALIYAWTEGGVEIAAGPTPSVPLAAGTHLITLTVTDPYGAAASDTVTINVSALDVTVVGIARKGRIVTATVRVTNRTGSTVTGASVTSASLAGIDASSTLPVLLGSIKPGASKQCKLQFKDVLAGQADLIVSGTSSLGAFFLTKSVYVP